MTAASDDTRERLIVLEQNVRHLTITAEKTALTVESMSELLHQAKGARWIILVAASVGGAIAAKLTIWAPWLLNGK